MKHGHALFSPAVCQVFEVLRVAANIWDGRRWYRIHNEPDLIAFEMAHGVEAARTPYNMKAIAEVKKLKRVIRREYAGYSDLFVPIVVKNQVQATLVTGPFATARPSSADVLERWRALTGRQGDPGDPEFAYYLSTSLSTLVLEKEQLAQFERLLACLSELMAGSGETRALTHKADRLRAELEQARFVERMWEAARSMVDERTSSLWSSPYRKNRRRLLGLARVPDQVLVGLTVSDESQEAVEEAMRRALFQRKSAELARSLGVVSGQVGDHGVSFLFSESANSGRRRPKLKELTERASALARRDFGYSLHFGVTAANAAPSLSRGYQAALAAAELAMSRNQAIVVAEARSSGRAPSLRELRRELARTAEQRAGERHAGELAARFDRYLEAVGTHSGPRLGAARVELETGFERIAEALLERGVIDERGLNEMYEALSRAAGEARSVSELFSAYRRVLSDLSRALGGGSSARQKRSLRRGLEYIQEHYGERLSLGKVAKVAGFSPKYFSDLFRERERISFEAYVGGLRIERAKQLLTGSDQNVERVAALSGFGSASYFCRVFRRRVGATPLEYRTHPEASSPASVLRKPNSRRKK